MRQQGNSGPCFFTYSLSLHLHFQPVPIDLSLSFLSIGLGVCFIALFALLVMRPCSSAPVSRRTEAPTSYEPQRTRASTPSASTPRSAAGGHPKSGQDLADTIKRIESRFHLGLRIRDETWSPAKSDGSLGDRVQGSIKTLYWSAYPTLNRVVDDFQHKLDTFPRLASRERLDLFHQLLRQETPKRRDTPSRPAAGNRPIYIPIPARDQAPKTLRSSLCKCQRWVSPSSTLLGVSVT